MLAGREFTRSDREGSPKVAIVNERFAAKFNLGRDVVGKRMEQGNSGKLDIEIVGLVKDAKYSEVKDAIPALFFRPYRQDAELGSINFYIRTARDAELMAASIPALVARLDPNLPLDNLRTLRQQVRENIVLDRLVTTLSAAFAGLATLLAAVGLYGVLAYMVAQRTREIGLRMALGAAPGHMRAMVLGQVARMTIVGGILGLVGAWLAGRAAESMLFEIKGHDPVVLTAATVLLIIVAARGRRDSGASCVTDRSDAGPAVRVAPPASMDNPRVPARTIARPDGASISYARSGAGPPVLLIQGVGIVGNGWRPQVEGLADRYTLVTFDNRGMGGSTLGEATRVPAYSVEVLAADALAVMDAEDLDRFHVVGHSLGGVIAQEVALQAPDRVRSLALLCTFCRGRDGAGLTPDMFVMGIRTRLGTRAMRRNAFLELVMPAAVLRQMDRARLAEQLAPLFGHDLADQPPIVMTQVRALARYDARARLAELSADPDAGDERKRRSHRPAVDWPRARGGHSGRPVRRDCWRGPRRADSAGRSHQQPAGRTLCRRRRGGRGYRVEERLAAPEAATSPSS